jgi:hypothetical protein
MIEADRTPSLSGLSPIGGSASETGGQEVGRPQPFGDFSTFETAAAASFARTAASADPVHAARAVASFVLQD